MRKALRQRPPLHSPIRAKPTPETNSKLDKTWGQRQLERQVCLSRYGTDRYAYCMLAAGQIDLVVEADLQPYDIIALIPIIEQAGGVVTDWDGGPAENGGAIV